MPSSIAEVTFSELEEDPDFSGMLKDYERECAVAALPIPVPDFAFYYEAEKADVLYSFAAKVDEILMGFLLMMVTHSPHYGAKIARVESFFVAEHCRGTGAGLRLLRKAEDLAAHLECAGIYISAPLNGKLAKVMARMPGYDEAYRIFLRGLPCKN